MVNGLDQDRARRCVGPGLGPNYLQRLSADDTSTCKQSVSIMSYWSMAFRWRANDNPILVLFGIGGHYY